MVVQMSAEKSFQLRVKASAQGLLLYALLSLWSHCAAGALDVTIFPNQTRVIMKKDFILKCKFTGYHNLSRTNVGVQWLGPLQKEIYTFDAGKHVPKRQGVKLSEADLLKGDASLFLPNVQIDDEGKYTCIVFVTPEKGEKSSHLLVLAQPEVHLSTDHITVLTGTERSVSCNVKGFYPKQFALTWEKITNKGKETLEDQFCTGAATPMDDGTFSVSSRVKIEPTLKDDGAMYQCTVTHQSGSDISKHTRLTVKEPEKHSSALAVAASIFGTLLLCAMFLAFGWLYWRRRGVPPEITEFSKPSVFQHFEKGFINYQVNGFRPSEIQVVLMLKRTGNENGTKIFERCCTQKTAENYRQLAFEIIRSEESLLRSDCWPDESFLPLEPTLSENSDRTFKLQGSVEVCPDVKRDNGAELILLVYHDTLAQPASKAITLEVKQVPPKMSNIVVPLQVHHNEPAALICSVIGFKPKPLQIIWQRIGRDDKLEELLRLDQERTIFARDNGNNCKYHHQISEVKYKDRSYGITSALVILPDVLQDQGTKYICQVRHVDTDEQKDTILKITAPPKSNGIICDAEKPVAGECMTLHCKIHSFYPQNITITWLKEGEKMWEEFNQSGPKPGNDGLYNLTTSVKTTLRGADVGKKYTCQIQHESLVQPLEVDWVLDQLISAPKITEVIAEPAHPEVGKPVTLSCKAYDFFPEGHQISWFKGFEKIKDGVKMDATVFDNSTRLYSRVSKMTFKPSVMDQGKDIKMEILHAETSNSPVSSNYRLKLFGIKSTTSAQLNGSIDAGVKSTTFAQGNGSIDAGIKSTTSAQGNGSIAADKPEISPITCQTPAPKVGQPVTISCTVTGCALGDCCITWYKGIYPFKETNCIENKPFENGVGFTTSLTYTPKQEDDNCQFCVEINIEMDTISRFFTMKLG
ncbi:uncharacterized protein LOC132824217 [Hemiscyllium ocellatum]|uniref:uncharacterized protein LOC132824217 n=1 Tax=Hemiscyllium ocellatum TaxID=170820 RepID=UPI0029677888|nr:uncharacterized protein LOC132824217 [Hemiscyllium ocellatum]